MKKFLKQDMTRGFPQSGSTEGITRDEDRDESVDDIIDW